MTVLFPIPLMGKGTPEIESLPSYLHRCAIGHGSDVGVFLQTLVRLLPHSRLYSLGKAKHLKPNEIVRPGEITDELILTLSEGTGERLEPSVLWVIRTVLGRSSNEVVRGFRWCPECLFEYESLGIEPYFKLIWHMKSVTKCHIHRTPLVQECEHCGCDQTSYVKKHSLGLCQDCGVSLGNRKAGISSSDLSSSWEDLGNDVVQLFKDLSYIDPRHLPVDGPKKSINMLLDYYWKIGKEKIFYDALTRDEMISLTTGEKRIDLITARRVAFRLGVPLYPFLAGEASQVSGILDYGMFCTLPEGYLDIHHKARKDHVAILSKLQHAHQCSDAPLTAKDICALAGVSTGYLSYRYPVLYREIVARRKAFEEEQRLKMIYMAQSAALRYFIDEKYSAAPKSRKQAYRRLREETGLPKWVLLNAIKVVYEAIFSGESNSNV